jgi:hypothetical protein
MSPFKHKFTANPDLDADGHRSYPFPPLNPPGWQEVDGIALPPITWAETDYTALEARIIANHTPRDPSLTTGRKVADFTTMSNEELDAEHKAWVERKPWTEEERAAKLLGTLFANAKDSRL